MKIRFFFFVIAIGFFIWPIFCWAETQVVINEIAWMGTESSANDEWLEIYNPSGQEIDLAGWKLKATDGTPEIALTGLIPAQGYFLLERTDDSSVPEITADQIYTGSFSNAGENMELRDADGNLIDQINCSDGWFAGDNSTKQTMERKNPGITGNDSSNWRNSQNPGGTPKAKNSAGEELPPEEPTGEPEQEPEITTTAPAPTNQPPQADAGQDVVALTNTEIVFDGSNSSDPENDSLTYFWNFGDGQTAEQMKASYIYQYPGTYIVTLTVSDGQNSSTDIIKVLIYSQAIVISEFLPSPEGKDEENEWIEIQNQSEQIADLSGWQIKDAASKSGFIFPEHSLIETQSYLVLKRETTKIALNNDQDTLSLFYPTGDLCQEINYQKAKEGASVNFLTTNQYVWSITPSPGMPNLITSANFGAAPISLEQLQKIQSQVEQIKEETGLTFNLPEFVSLATWSEKESVNLLNLLPQPVIAQVTEPSVEQISESLTQASDEKTASQKQANQLTAALGTRLNKNPEIILILTIIISSGLFGLWLVQIRKKLKTQL